MAISEFLKNYKLISVPECGTHMGLCKVCGRPSLLTWRALFGTKVDGHPDEMSIHELCLCTECAFSALPWNLKPDIKWEDKAHFLSCLEDLWGYYIEDYLTCPEDYRERSERLMRENGNKSKWRLFFEVCQNSSHFTDINWQYTNFITDRKFAELLLLYKLRVAEWLDLFDIDDRQSYLDDLESKDILSFLY